MLRKIILVKKIITALLRDSDNPLYVRLANVVEVVFSAWKRTASDLLTALDYLEALMSGCIVAQYFTTSAPGRHLALPFQGSSWIGLPLKHQMPLSRGDVFARGTEIIEVLSMPEELKSAPNGTLLCVKNGMLQKTL
jgi:hypothetical protein